MQQLIGTPLREFRIGITLRVTLMRSKALLIVGASVFAVLQVHGAADAKVLPYELQASSRRVDPGEAVRIRVVLDPANVIAVERMRSFVSVFRGDHRNAQGLPRRGPHVDVPMREVGTNEYLGEFSSRTPGVYLISGFTSTVVDGKASPQPIRLRVTDRGRPAASDLRWVGPTVAIVGLAAILGSVFLVRARRPVRPS